MAPRPNPPTRLYPPPRFLLSAPTPQSQALAPGPLLRPRQAPAGPGPPLRGGSPAPRLPQGQTGIPSRSRWWGGGGLSAQKARDLHSTSGPPATWGAAPLRASAGRAGALRPPQSQDPAPHSCPEAVPARAPSGSVSSPGLGTAKTTELRFRNAGRLGAQRSAPCPAPPPALGATARSRPCPEGNGLSSAAAGRPFTPHSSIRLTANGVRRPPN